MNEKHRAKIKKLMAKVDCPRNFKCVESGGQLRCKVKDIGMDSYVKCLEVSSSNCKFLLHYGSYHFCKCPLGVYLTKASQEPKAH